MRTTRQLSITLPKEMAKMVSERVASGEYANESEVVRDGLRALMEREKATEDWLRNEVVQAYDAMKKEPVRGRSLDEVRATLSIEYGRATNAK